MSTKEPLTRPRLRTPRAAAIAGIVFSVLLGAAIILARLSVPPAQADSGLLTSPHDRTTTAIALNLVPFAGIAFLWFIGVVRDRVGQHEDRFFASVFLGSGLLFVAMLFVASAVASAVILDSAVRLSPAAWALGRRVSYGLLNVYAMRMAAVFAISTATIAMRTKIIPRWLGITGYTVGAVLLVAVDALPWLELAFPLWTLLLSVRILIAGLQAPGDQARLAGQLDLARPPRAALTGHITQVARLQCWHQGDDQGEHWSARAPGEPRPQNRHRGAPDVSRLSGPSSSPRRRRRKRYAGPTCSTN